MNELITVSGVRGFIDANGLAQLNLEDVARGLGFTQEKNGSEYVRWDRVSDYLRELRFSPQVGNDGYGTLFIPENIFYRLAMKAKNETAEKFQALVADDILPAIRKHGMYLAPDVATMAIEDKEAFLAKAVIAAQDVITSLKTKLEAAKPAMAFVERYVEAAALKNFREVAKILGIKERDFIDRLLDWQIVYRMHRTLLPFATYQHKGYFEVKTGEKDGFAYHQTKFTPAGIAWIAQKFTSGPPQGR